MSLRSRPSLAFRSSLRPASPAFRSSLSLASPAFSSSLSLAMSLRSRPSLAFRSSLRPASPAFISSLSLAMSLRSRPSLAFRSSLRPASPAFISSLSRASTAFSSPLSPASSLAMSLRSPLWEASMAVPRPTAARMIPINSLLTSSPRAPSGLPGSDPTGRWAGCHHEGRRPLGCRSRLGMGHPSLPMKRRAPRCRFSSRRPLNGKGVHPEVHPLVGLTKPGSSRRSSAQRSRRPCHRRRGCRCSRTGSW